MAHPVPENESDRVLSLLNLKILDTDRDPEFDKLVAVVQDIFEVPMVAISLIDADRLWLKASTGFDVAETSRDVAFCSHTICSDAPFVVPDATKDCNFILNPLVCGDPNIRSYAGVSLAVEPGLNIGSLCVIDTKPRHYAPADLQRLRYLVIWLSRS